MDHFSSVAMLLFFGCLVTTLIACALAKEELQSFSVILQYVHLASDIQTLIRTSSVFIVHTSHNENIQETILMTKMLKEFSRKNVLSQCINFTKLHYEVQYYDGKSVQPLFVIMLKTMNDLHKFAATTKLHNMALHTWLIVFMQSSDERLGNYCQEPRENLFNLVITTQLLVKCYNDPMLKEWYSIDNEKVEAINYGIWRHPYGVTRIQKMHFFERRSNLKGMRLKVAAVKDLDPLSGSKNTSGGFYGNILQDLSLMMNFTTELVSVDPAYGVWNETTKRWTGAIRRLIEGEVDIGVGAFTMIPMRKEVIDYTVPVMLTTSDIYIKRPNVTDVDWSVYIKAFNMDLWMVVVITIIITPMFLSVMWKFTKGHDVSSSIVEEYLRVWGIYCQKPLPDFPTVSSLRVAYISIFMSSLVLFAVYSAYLTSYHMVFTPDIPFNSYKGFVADGTYKLILFRSSSNYDLFKRTNIPLFKEMGKLLKSDEELPYDIFEAIQQVCNEKVVLYTNQLFVEKISRYSPCKLMPLTQGKLDNVGLALVKNSPYTEIFNYNLKILRAYGIIECLQKRYYRKFVYNDSNYLPVSIWEIVPILGILCLGIVLSLLLLFCEHISNRRLFFHKRKRINLDCPSNMKETILFEQSNSLL